MFDQKALEHDLSQMEHRYQDGILQSETFWRIFVLEVCLLSKKYDESKEASSQIVNCFEDIERKMGYQKPELKKDTTYLNTGTGQKREMDQENVYSRRKKHTLPYQL